MRQVQSMSVLLRLHRAAFCLQHSSNVALAALLATISVVLPETASPGSIVPFLRSFLPSSTFSYLDSDDRRNMFLLSSQRESLREAPLRAGLASERGR